MEFVQQQVTMADDQGRRRRRRGLIALLLGLSVLTLGSGVFSLAVFQSSDDSVGNFSTGTIVLDASPATVFNANAIFPGDSGSATLTVSNAGTGELRYVMTSDSVDPDDLGGAIALTIREGACPSAGTTLYSGDLDSAAWGTATQGSQGDELVLASGDFDELCFSWSLPLGTGDALQDKSVSTTFTFLAEQTANNP